MGIAESKSKYQGSMKLAVDTDRYGSEFAEWIGNPAAATGPMARNWKAQFSSAAKRKAKADRWEQKLLAAAIGEK